MMRHSCLANMNGALLLLNTRNGVARAHVVVRRALERVELNRRHAKVRWRRVEPRTVARVLAHVLQRVVVALRAHLLIVQLMLRTQVRLRFARAVAARHGRNVQVALASHQESFHRRQITA